jgi:hypothetical protein
MKKKATPVNYTSRDFDSIKKDLVSYVKRYYPDTYKDFNQLSFGSMMLDLVSYLGDNLSFYLDYNANESFLATSLEYDNVLMHAKQLGYKYDPNRSSVGEVDIYMPVPAQSQNVAPDLNYLPRLLKGTTFINSAGIPFTLIENVKFNSDNSEVIGSEVSSDGAKTTYYIVKSRGKVISGREKQIIAEVGDFQRFLKLEVAGEAITEIVSVVDTAGNEYFEVDNLSQDLVYRAITRPGTGDANAPSLMRAYPTPRRFVVEREGDKTYLVFGYGSEKDISNDKIADPASVALDMTGKNYVSRPTFDPERMISSDKFGVSPVNTDLTITYRYNTRDNVNVAAGSLTSIGFLQLAFDNEQSLDPSKIQYIRNNIEIYNESPIVGDISVPTTEEIKKRAMAQFAMQSRAVTAQDYVSATYSMPSNFGSVKRASVQRDNDDFRRNLNLFIISEDEAGSLTKSSDTLKENLRTWLNSVKMMSDSVDILDASIINLGIEFEVVGLPEMNKGTIYNEIRQKLFDEFTSIPPDIGQSFYLTDIFKFLKEIDGVLDVVDVKLVNKVGDNYSSYSFNVDGNLSSNGRVLNIPSASIWELKYITDIVGNIR